MTEKDDSISKHLNVSFDSEDYSEVIENMEAITHMLNSAKLPSFDHNGEQKEEIDLTCEVIFSAMDFLRNNPKSSILDACEHGLNEWIK